MGDKNDEERLPFVHMKCDEGSRLIEGIRVTSLPTKHQFSCVTLNYFMGFTYVYIERYLSMELSVWLFWVLSAFK